MLFRSPYGVTGPPPQYDGTIGLSAAGGGGAAYGAQGGDVTSSNPTLEFSATLWTHDGASYYFNLDWVKSNRHGGTGATALTTSASSFTPRRGQGGSGGNGGGGGGSPSFALYTGSYYSPILWDGNVGQGGNGSAGGNGGNGIVIILY